MKLLSVVIAAYNQETEIRRAVQSALCQDVPDLEVIVVNDGSRDGTGAVLSEIAAADPRVHLITKENGGVSAARNDGIRAATGRWLITLDGDDYFEPGIFRKLLQAAGEAETADLVISGMFYDYPDRREEFEPEAEFDGDLRGFLGKPFIPLYDSHLLTTHCNKLYDLGIIRENGIYYKEDIAINEDIDFVFRYLGHCRKIRVIKAPCIHYVQHDAGKSQITTFREYGVSSSLTVLGDFFALTEKLPEGNYPANPETVADEDNPAEAGTVPEGNASDGAFESSLTGIYNRLLVHILSFNGLMYRNSGYPEAQKLSELQALMENTDFRRLLDLANPSDIKTSLARRILRSGKVRIYHRLCRVLYR